MIVNGNNVEATGLFVEHYQKTEVAWNGQNGKMIFFQNEMPYDPPNQAAWMNGTLERLSRDRRGQQRHLVRRLGPGQLLLLQRQSRPSTRPWRSSRRPTAGMAWHDLLTVSLGDVGTITHVINTTGAVTPTNTTPSDVISFP